MHAAEELGLIQCDLGNWAEAGRCAAYGPDDYQPSLRLACRARIAAHEGRHDEAALLVRRALEESDQSDLLNRRARIWCAAADVHRAGGREARPRRPLPVRSSSTSRRGTSRARRSCTAAIRSANEYKLTRYGDLLSLRRREPGGGAVLQQLRGSPGGARRPSAASS